MRLREEYKASCACVGSPFLNSLHPPQACTCLDCLCYRFEPLLWDAELQEFPLRRYADKLEAAHDTEHLAKFEELLEAAVDLDRIPDEYLICASYDADLQVQI